MEERIATLRRILDESSYTVALCGSGMMEEGGYIGVKNPDKAYDIEKKYGYSPEEIFTSAFYNTRPKLFFDFYKQEMLNGGPEPTESETVLEKMEQDGKLQCIITSNIYELCQRSGCKNVIELHGSIYHNICQRCGREYPVEYKTGAWESCMRGLSDSHSPRFVFLPGNGGQSAGNAGGGGD